MIAVPSHSRALKWIGNALLILLATMWSILGFIAIDTRLAIAFLVIHLVGFASLAFFHPWRRMLLWVFAAIYASALSLGGGTLLGLLICLSLSGGTDFLLSLVFLGWCAVVPVYLTIWMAQAGRPPQLMRTWRRSINRRRPAWVRSGQAKARRLRKWWARGARESRDTAQAS